MSLLPSQRAEIFTIIQASGISPGGMEWRTIGSDYVRGKGGPAIFMTGTNYFFAFDSAAGSNDRVSRFSPGEEFLVEALGAQSWAEQLNHVIAWCGFLNRELSASDPWSDLERQAVPFNIDTSHQSSSQQFNVSEFERASKTLLALQALLLTYAKDNEDYQREIKTSVAKLIEGAKTQDRKSWFFAVVGFVASTAVSLGLAPEQTKALYEALKTGLVGAVHLISH
jgi:hypothetical protein